MGKNISKSSLARANQDRDYHIFEEYTYNLVNEARLKHVTHIFKLGGFVAFFESVAREDERLVSLGEYLQLFRGWIGVVAGREQGGKEALQMLKRKLYLIGHRIKGPLLAAYLTDECMSGYVKSFGVDGIQELLPFYRTKVTDPVKVAAFRQLYAQWSKLAKGQPSPGFSYEDINGGKVSLTDLRGKYDTSIRSGYVEKTMCPAWIIKGKIS